MKTTATKRGAREIFARVYARYGMWIILAAMAILMTILTPNFLTKANLMNLVRQVSFIAIIGFGSAFVLISGGMDLSPGSVVALTSVISASFAKGEYPLIVAILMGLLVGFVCGAVNGLLVTRLNVPPFIATLGMMQSARGVAMLYSGGNSITGLTDGFKFLGQGSVLGVPVPILIMFAIAVIMYILLDHTPYGRRLVAVGDNAEAARISGINTKLVSLSVFIIGGVLASVTSILMSARIASGQPILGTGYEMDAISASVIGGVSLKGGVGSIWGVMCGALIIGIINNGMDLVQVSSYWQQIVKGAIIVIAIILDQLKTRKA